MSLDNPAQLLPELLDRLAALGEMAKQVSNALGGNGHRPNKAAALIEQLTKGLDSTSSSPDRTNVSCKILSIDEDPKVRGYE